MSESKNEVDIVVSINVYKLPDFLDSQIKTISDHITSTHAIILNCNNYMFNALKGRSLPSNVFINPEIIEKRITHGSLTHGIVSNMLYAHSHFVFKYFLILSGRTILYRNLTSVNLDRLQKKWGSMEDANLHRKAPPPANDWHWPAFKLTLVAQHYLSQGYTLHGTEHEGLCFSYPVFKNIVTYFNEHASFANDLFAINSCVEEFALQSIASNEVDPSNLEYGFINIGNGCYEAWDKINTNKFTRKVLYPA